MTKQKRTAAQKNTIFLLMAIPIAIVAIFCMTLGPWLWVTLFDKPYERQPTSPEETAQAVTRLQGRSSLEDAESKALELMSRVQAIVTDIHPRMTWTVEIGRVVSDCEQPFDRTEGKTISYSSAGTTGDPGDPVPVSGWEEFSRRSVAASSDLGLPVTENGVPKYRRMELVSADRTLVIRMHNQPASEATRNLSATPARTVLSLELGCHLPADKRSSPIRPTS
ncbi:LppA family lipoprotein [Nocardia caishijiensis]|uniref:LppA-like lipoprotein n=1 Tax=Nocardia caishijiensis TaxID=184756 RepID=A0ABQ6YJP9_9NOCA|nr:LppA family lipoprotein [Nocardia caishijiensis]KAF0846014.1 putative LppA-like lipoprotein [Nocardia caishijiensis]